jgi:alanyl-tRNA synthetase
LNAPLEKLDKTAEKLVKELKEANAEKHRLIKELAAKEGAAFEETKTESIAIQDRVETTLIRGAKEIAGVKLILGDFRGTIDVDRMVQTANEIIKRDEATVTLFYGTDGKTARILIMAGKTAVEKGVNAGEIVRVVSPMIGGGGGGKPNFAQGGGTKPEKLQEAVAKAEDSIRKHLNEKN